MHFEWDENKRNDNITNREVDLLYAALIFEGEVLTRIDDRKNYGEVREISIGEVGSECFIVVHTNRKGKTRLITAWKGGHEEREKYKNGIAQRHHEAEGEG